MNRVNLIPPHRRRAKAQRARLRAWIVAGGGYAAILGLGAAYLACSAMASQTGAVAPAAPSTAPGTDVHARQQQLKSLCAEIAQLQQAARAVDSVAHQPDYSRLLVAVALNLGDDVTLDSCECAPVTTTNVASFGVAAPKPATPAAPGVAAGEHVLLKLTGYGRSQASVSQFVLRLEQLAVFDQVRLLATTRIGTADGEAISFSLECPLRGTTGVQQ